MAPQNPRRTWRHEDLLELPDDGRRYEIVEGELFELPSPGWDHQTVAFNLVTLLALLVEARGGTLRFAPLDVFFQGADPVQPDVVVLLPGGAARPSARGVEGPPDLLIEVIGPSTRGRDLKVKPALYARAGVPECWTVDPEERTVTVHVFDRGIRREPARIERHGVIESPNVGGAIAAAAIFAGLGNTATDG